MIHPLNEVEALYVRVYYRYYSYYGYSTYCISWHGRTYGGSHTGIRCSGHFMGSYIETALFAFYFFICVFFFFPFFFFFFCVFFFLFVFSFFICVFFFFIICVFYFYWRFFFCLCLSLLGHRSFYPEKKLSRA